MLLPVLSPAYDTDSKQTRDRAQTLLRHAARGADSVRRRLKSLQRSSRGLRLQAMLMPLEGGAGAAAAARSTGSCWRQTLVSMRERQYRWN
jgi:hypothetical protein